MFKPPVRWVCSPSPRPEFPTVPVRGIPPLTQEEHVALDHDYRHGPDRLLRQRSHIVLLARPLNNHAEIARVVGCHPGTVWRALTLYRRRGREGLRRAAWSKPHCSKRNPRWQAMLSEAMERGAEACGIPRPTWTAPLLAEYLAEQSAIVVSERTVRRGLADLGYVCRRGTWTVTHKAEEQPGYFPKRRGSRHS